MKKKIGDPKVALKLFLYFFRIGWFTFGGGFSIIAQMQKDFVDKKKLVTEETILDQTSIGRSLPGLLVANVAYLFGFSQGGLIAGLAYAAGILTPPIVLLALVTMCYTAFRDNVYVARALVGVRAAVPPIIAGAALRLRKGAFAGGAFSYIVCAAALAVTLFTGISIVWAVIGSAILGIAFSGVKRHGRTH